MGSCDEPGGPAEPHTLGFESCLRVACSVILPPTNFNNRMVPHQHTEHEEPPSPTLI